MAARKVAVKKMTAEQLRAEERLVSEQADAYLASPERAAEIAADKAKWDKTAAAVAKLDAKMRADKRAAEILADPVLKAKFAAEAKRLATQYTPVAAELESDDLDAVPTKAPATPTHHHADDVDGDLRGQLTNEADLIKFISAGNAILTVVSRGTGKRLTFKFSRPKDDAAPYDPIRSNRSNWAPTAGRPKPIFVALLSGPDNGADYQFLGTIWPEARDWTYKVSAKSRVSYTAPSQEFVRWFVKYLNVNPANLFANAEIWHEGRCGRCGRRLTVPESVASGFGPECINHV